MRIEPRRISRRHVRGTPKSEMRSRLTGAAPAPVACVTMLPPIPPSLATIVESQSPCGSSGSPSKQIGVSRSCFTSMEVFSGSASPSGKNDATESTVLMGGGCSPGPSSLNSIPPTSLEDGTSAWPVLSKSSSPSFSPSASASPSISSPSISSPSSTSTSISSSSPSTSSFSPSASSPSPSASSASASSRYFCSAAVPSPTVVCSWCSMAACSYSRDIAPVGTNSPPLPPAAPSSLPQGTSPPQASPSLLSSIAASSTPTTWSSSATSASSTPSPSGSTSVHTATAPSKTDGATPPAAAALAASASACCCCAISAALRRRHSSCFHLHERPLWQRPCW
mmetsp:Transcript_521/g.1435  ORF Transcript_521/g.1435 Transcript_521/m.1435 type:complete len:338 (+) Transcript_521:1004-2017(+)